MGTRWGMTCKLDQSRHPLEPRRFGVLDVHVALCVSTALSSYLRTQLESLPAHGLGFGGGGTRVG
jgi:hypothetical protein